MAGEPDVFYIVISFAKCVEASSFQNRSVPVFFFMTKVQSEADAALAAHSQAVCFVANEYLFGGAPA
jgi:hypothetical protein